MRRRGTVSFPALAAAFAVITPAQEAAVGDLVASLARAESLSGDAEHEGGGQSPTWRVFARLRAIASTPELERLLAHDSPIVRNYAARALADRGARVDWPAVLAARIGDDVMVATDDGCLHDRVRSGDLLFGLAQERGLLTRAQWLDLAERLLRADAKLAARDRLLGTMSFPATMRPLLRACAERGDDAALVALARMRQTDDVPRLVAALTRQTRFDSPAFVAAALFPDGRLLAPLVACRDRAFAAAVEGNVWDLERWVAAVVAQRTPDAAGFLTGFRHDVLAHADRGHDGHLREQCDAMLRTVLGGEDAAGPFGVLKVAVTRRR